MQRIEAPTLGTTSPKDIATYWKKDGSRIKDSYIAHYLSSGEAYIFFDAYCLMPALEATKHFYTSSERRSEWSDRHATALLDKVKQYGIIDLVQAQSGNQEFEAFDPAGVRLMYVITKLSQVRNTHPVVEKRKEYEGQRDGDFRGTVMAVYEGLEGHPLQGFMYIPVEWGGKPVQAIQQPTEVEDKQEEKGETDSSLIAYLQNVEYILDTTLQEQDWPRKIAFLFEGEQYSAAMGIKRSPLHDNLLPQVKQLGIIRPHFVRHELGKGYIQAYTKTDTLAFASLCWAFRKGIMEGAITGEHVYWEDIVAYAKKALGENPLAAAINQPSDRSAFAFWDIHAAQNAIFPLNEDEKFLFVRFGRSMRRNQIEAFPVETQAMGATTKEEILPQVATPRGYRQRQQKERQKPTVAFVPPSLERRENGADSILTVADLANLREVDPGKLVQLYESMVRMQTEEVSGARIPADLQLAIWNIYELFQRRSSISQLPDDLQNADLLLRLRYILKIFQKYPGIKNIDELYVRAQNYK